MITDVRFVRCCGENHRIIVSISLTEPRVPPHPHQVQCRSKPLCSTGQDGRESTPPQIAGMPSFSWPPACLAVVSRSWSSPSFTPAACSPPDSSQPVPDRARRGQVHRQPYDHDPDSLPHSHPFRLHTGIPGCPSAHCTGGRAVECSASLASLPCSTERCDPASTVQVETRVGTWRTCRPESSIAAGSTPVAARRAVTVSSSYR